MKTMKKILSLALVCVMLIGAISAFGVTANAEENVNIVAMNVFHGETMKLECAVDTTADATVNFYLDADCTNLFCSATEDGTVVYGGVTCKKFVANKGVPAQDMNLVLYAKAEIEGASDVASYSVLQYFNAVRFSATTSNAQKALAVAAIEFAKAAEAVLYADATDRVSAPVADTYYVEVGADVKGVATGIYAAGSTPFADVATDLVAGAGEKLVWTVTNLDNGQDRNYAVEDLQAMVLSNNVAINVAVGADASEPVTETMDIFANKGQTGTKTISWASGDVTVSNAQAGSTNPIRTSDADHYRVYAKSEFTVAAPSISKIVIYVTESKYMDPTGATLATSGEADATVTSDTSAKTYTIEFATPVDSVTFTSTAQWRLDSISVTYLP